jgi:hypothetical protein
MEIHTYVVLHYSMHIKQTHTMSSHIKQTPQSDAKTTEHGHYNKRHIKTHLVSSTPNINYTTHTYYTQHADTVKSGKRERER